MAEFTGMFSVSLASVFIVTSTLEVTVLVTACDECVMFPVPGIAENTTPVVTGGGGANTSSSRCDKDNREVMVVTTATETGGAGCVTVELTGIFTEREPEATAGGTFLLLVDP